MEDNNRATESNSQEQHQQPQNGGGDEAVAAEVAESEEVLVSRVQKLMEKITSSPENPNLSVLHALSSILETEEARYLEQIGHYSFNNVRSSHIIGRLGNLIRDNDEFFELISSKFLSETWYPISIQAAAARLLLSCANTWIYPHDFEENVLERIRGWIMDENNRGSVAEGDEWKHGLEENKGPDFDVLKTYSTGLLALSLSSGGRIVEDVLTSGLSAKLMRYLYTRVFGDTTTNKKDEKYFANNNVSSASATGTKSREESRGKIRHEKDSAHAATHAGNENGINDSSRGSSEHGRVKTDGDANKNKVTSTFKSLDVIKVLDDDNKSLGRVNDVECIIERDDNDECFQGCKVGSKDFSNFVKKAVRAAENEANAANAPVEAIKAAGDAAAELVKSAAFKEFKNTGNEEAAIMSASRAASTVIDAAGAIEVSKNSVKIAADSINEMFTDPKVKDEEEEHFVLDTETLLVLRERFCMQCLEILGEYVEILGPVLHEKGVDVCLALLQRSSKLNDSSKVTLLLPDILKLISALAVYRKFAALFVDQGGMQKLLAVPRTSKTLFGLSSCLFTISSLQGIMERVCALPSDVVHQIVELALQLLKCPQDQARKNAALFFNAAFVFKAILDCFDAQDGLQNTLNLLNNVAVVRSGINSSGLTLSNSESLRADQSPAEVLTSAEKQIAYHTCVALRQYFRAHLLLLVDSIRPTKHNRSAARNIPSLRAPYMPFDVSNEAMDAVFIQLQHDRKLGPAFVRACWPEVDKFISFNGHIVLLELCQAPPAERYLHDLVQFALDILHIVSLVPCARKLIVNAPLSNDRVGITVILDAANCASYVEPEIIQPALNVLVSLICPPPSISNKPSFLFQSHQFNSVQPTDGPVPSVASGWLVGDRRICLGTGAGNAGLAAQIEQGYSQAREAVRFNNGIKVLLLLLQPRIFTPPVALDCLRALACRVLLGLARDDTIAHILTKLQVGNKLSDMILDHPDNHTHGSEQCRWQAELEQAAIELIGIVTNSGRASAVAATDAAVPALRRIERASIAAATPITYHSRELLLLIHEHLQASGLSTTAATLLKEAGMTPLPSLATPSSLAYQVSTQETSSIHIQWPSGRSSCGFLYKKSKPIRKGEDSSFKIDSSAVSLSKTKPSIFSRYQLQSHNEDLQISASTVKPNLDLEPQFKTPISFSSKRKLSELMDNNTFGSSTKRLNTGYSTPTFTRRDQYKKSDNLEDNVGQATPSSSIQYGIQNDPVPITNERLTLDSLVVQYLKQQHRQCSAPITTLPPLSLLQPHVCPEPKQSLDAPSNVTARLCTREFRTSYGGIHGNRKDRQFVNSRFRPWRTCRDDTSSLLTCISFLGGSHHIAVGGHSGELKIFDSNTNSLLESNTMLMYPITHLETRFYNDKQLLLSSNTHDVVLWDASSFSSGPIHYIDACKAARFSNNGTVFAALSSETTRKEILLYDVHTGNFGLKLSDTYTGSSGKGQGYSVIHFSPDDTMLLWNGVLWDPRLSEPIHRFDKFTDFGGGGFHPAGNEVIINSEVWDLRKFKLLRSVPSLDQTVIKFNGHGDVIYGILRRNLYDITSVSNTRRSKHPLYSAFQTVDAVNYSDIATIPLDRCVLDFAMEPTDSFLGLVTMDDQEDMVSSARIYEIGRRRLMDDDSDPDDAETEEDEDDDEDGDDDQDSLLGHDFDSYDEVSMSELESDDEELDFGGEDGMLQIVSDDEGEDDDDNENDDEDSSSNNE